MDMKNALSGVLNTFTMKDMKMKFLFYQLKTTFACGWEVELSESFFSLRLPLAVRLSQFVLCVFFRFKLYSQHQKALIASRNQTNSYTFLDVKIYIYADSEQDLAVQHYILLSSH